MISTELYDDLCSFNIKLLFVGDPGQLEPVGDNPNLMKVCDFTLSKIHRQAEDSPIIVFATRIRLGNLLIPRPSDSATTTTSSVTVQPKELNGALLTGVNQLIVARNTTRKTFNDRFRQYYKYPAQTIVPGDKLICLRNNASFAVFNGMILFVHSIVNESASYWNVKFRDEFGLVFNHIIPVWKDPFRRELAKHENCPKIYAHFDYGYAITCHKSQGSEWDRVLVYDEFMPPKIWCMKRWRYTAVTRASKELIFCI
jgi:exodeoxyribonuclease-5